MGDYSLAVAVRSETGKSYTRKLRATGRVPAVLYGHGKESLPLTFDTRELEQLLRKSDAGVNTLIDLEGDQQVAGRIVLIKELQRHPVQGTLVHADLYEVDATASIQVTVPIHLTGTSAGVKLGGNLEHTLREIDLDCLPNAIPDSIDIDISELEIGDSVHVNDLVLPEGVTSRLNETVMVAHISEPRMEEEVEVSEEAAIEEAPEAEEAKSDD